MPAPTLAETQRLLWRLITAPNGVADGLRTLGDADGLLPDGLEAILCGDAVLPAVRRLDIYANMYFFRLHDALKADFPAVFATIGARDFHNLITDYLWHYPPTQPSLRGAGQDLPGFLRHHRLSDSQPFLADLAQLEWALLDAFDAPDVATLSASALAAVAPAAWSDLRLRLTPSLQILAFDWAVAETWQRVQDGASPGLPPAQPTHVRVWRRDLQVWHRQMARDEHAALRAALDDQPFAALCEAVAAHLGGEAAAARMADLIQQWLADGLLTGTRSDAS